MAPNKKLTFEVTVKKSMFITLPIPKRINQLVDTLFIKARRADDSQWYNLSRVYIMFGDKEEIHWGHGWDKFMEEQNIQLQDKLEITYEGCKCFRVKVFRGGRVVPIATESDVIVLSSGSSTDVYHTGTGSLSDGSSSESVWSKSESSGRSSDFAGTQFDGTR
ncbi:uncharacterized protein LOC110710780 [Chenopodium quinoa]|uniref:uncharacterized protein LOC110710780 n=1 Tax=Chenopodium quinoa TaxID=63459 RepID=UPI000B798B00|nr:uncharacterized protein LOC110710780 [Chenopodium quinoa]